MPAKNIERRKRVMQRSIRLGHCICDPRQPCPCPSLITNDICSCAGERPEPNDAPVALTRLVEKAGCASKIDLNTLKDVVAGLRFHEDPRVLIGAAAGDDAGVFEFEDGKCLVQTVDVFSPSVDDPYEFGRVAAANSLSDIYAMGAEPLTALSIVGFPAQALPARILTKILQGGLDTMREAGVAVIGGHSIQDSQIKAGFAVTAVLARDKVVARAGARPGDVLILTKPIGTGIVSFAAQIGRASEESIHASVRSMTTLNKTAARLMIEHNASACTDVTGFSLIGHLAEMASGSQLNAELVWDEAPLLPGVLEYVAASIVPGATERNKEAVLDRVELADGIDPRVLDICCDPQTSGGLLIAVPEVRAAALVASLRAGGCEQAAAVGRMLAPGNGDAGRIRVVARGSRIFPASNEPASRGAAPSGAISANMKSKTEMNSESCCAPAPTDANPAHADPIASVEQKFLSFLQAAAAPKGLDASAKQAIAVALSVLSKCEPCLVAHIHKARKMGFSQEEIDDAAWSAIAFGGSPVMMFYQGVKDKMAEEGRLPVSREASGA